MATAQADKGQQMVIMEAGGNGHVPKPFDEEQISKGIEKAFSTGMEKAQHTTKQRSIMGGKVELNVSHIQITDQSSRPQAIHLRESQHSKMAIGMTYHFGYAF